MYNNFPGSVSKGQQRWIRSHSRYPLYTLWKRLSYLNNCNLWIRVENQGIEATSYDIYIIWIMEMEYFKRSVRKMKWLLKRRNRFGKNISIPDVWWSLFLIAIVCKSGKWMLWSWWVICLNWQPLRKSHDTDLDLYSLLPRKGVMIYG